jgi:hypothetical protein
MDYRVAALFWVVSFVCFLLAAFGAGARFGDRVKFIAFGLAAFVLVTGWDAVWNAFNK